MKNIHIIPTDKPSRLFITEGKLFNYHKPQEGDGIKIINQNIYITNDEEPKDGDWVIEYIFDNLIFKVYSTTSEFVKKSKFHSLPRNHCKKIILTTDTDLIADGVQSIPDDFLEWFVKNPSCEFVELKNWYNGYLSCCQSKNDCYCNKKRIIIPKGEPKQETLEEAAEINLTRLCYYDKRNPDFQIKEEYGYDKEEVEATGNFAKKDCACDNCFYGRSKLTEQLIWQQERMYSEEKVIKSFDNLGFKRITSEELNSLPYQPFITDENGDIWVIDKKKWFEQFKKK